MIRILIKYRGGLHGVGVSCVNALSENLVATVFRDGKIWQQEYSRGKSKAAVATIGDTTETGTEVTFKPDSEIFKQTLEYNYETLSLRMRELSYLNKGIKIVIIDKRNKDDQGEFVSETFQSKEGLKEFIHFLDESREAIIGDVIAMEGEKNGCACRGGHDLQHLLF